MTHVLEALFAAHNIVDRDWSLIKGLSGRGKTQPDTITPTEFYVLGFVFMFIPSAPSSLYGFIVRQFGGEKAENIFCSELEKIQRVTN